MNERFRHFHDSTFMIARYLLEPMCPSSAQRHLPGKHRNRRVTCHLRILCTFGMLRRETEGEKMIERNSEPFGDRHVALKHVKLLKTDVTGWRICTCLKPRKKAQSVAQRHSRHQSRVCMSHVQPTKTVPPFQEKSSSPLHHRLVAQGSAKYRHLTQFVAC